MHRKVTDLHELEPSLTSKDDPPYTIIPMAQKVRLYELHPLMFENSENLSCIGPFLVRHIRAFVTTHPIAIKSTSVVQKRMYLLSSQDIRTCEFEAN
ncbi:hypothetical protein AVEN_274250-1 [Araneus ventricosus]|uniref:Uncharacterized protein n=1 Tax=Araneus ventricosus TaxID=182803 RepID=A0A4Y2HUH4_ARAVE|nr:hypothetical protein AVEN_274250-1 [Araneus ventricosus]